MAGFSQPGSTSSNSLPYLRGASSGANSTTTTPIRSPDTVSKFGANQESYNAEDQALRQYRQQERISSGIKFGSIDRASFGNGNPMFKKGETIVTMSDGQQLRIPNAVAQQLEFTQSQNQGRWDAGEAFGESSYQKEQRAGSNPQDVRYTAWGGTQGRVDEWMKNNPNFSGSGFINPAQEKMSRIQDLDTQINNLSRQMLGGARRETVSASGQDTSGGNNYVSAIEALRRSRDQIGSLSRAERNAASGGGNVFGDSFPALTATYSNLPVVERMVNKQ